MFWFMRLLLKRFAYTQNKEFIKKTKKQKLLKRFVAYKMIKDKKEIPQAFLSKIINLNNLAQARKRIIERENTKLSFFSLIMKNIAKTLMQNPEMNTHSLKRKLVYFNTANITFVVAGEKADDPATVRTIYNVEKKELKKIDAEIKELAKNAMEKPMDVKEAMKIGGFGVSNFGSLGVDIGFTPAMFPYSAILGIGYRQKNGDAMFTISFDHRWIEGHAVNKFLLDLKENIEST